MKSLFFLFFFFCVFTVGGQILVDHTCTQVDKLSVERIKRVKESLHIGYGHTSHGSQLITGMTALSDAYGSLYAFSGSQLDGSLELVEGGDLRGDVGANANWVADTETFLDKPGNGRFNVVMWSWCGQLSLLTTQKVIDNYLIPMTQLELKYPNVKFVYMTGHLDGTGANGTLNKNNQQIRTYCQENRKILYDFADIESFDPNGLNVMELGANDDCTYVLDAVGEVNWAVKWCHANPSGCLPMGDCAHSQSLNCQNKGVAAWWLFSSLLGSQGVSTHTGFQNSDPVVVVDKTGVLRLYGFEGVRGVEFKVVNVVGSVVGQGIIEDNVVDVKKLGKGCYVFIAETQVLKFIVV